MKIKLLCLLVFQLVACGSMPETHYYLIDYPVDSAEALSPRYDAVLGVARFNAESPYENDRIVYRESPNEVKFYQYHRWVDSPEVIVTEKIIEELSNAGLFRQVVFFPRSANINYLLRGSIKRFEEWDEGSQWYARVELQFELIRRTDNALLWTDVISRKTKVDHRTPIEVVRAMSIGLQECIGEAVKGIEGKVE